MPDDRSSPATTPYGAWPSPISARSVAEGARRIDDLAAAGDNVCWLERRPEEGGRNVLVCLNPDGSTRTLTPDGFDVRSRVHEYGGGAFLLLAGAGAPAFWPAAGAMPRSGEPEPLPHAFVNFSDQRVYLATAAATIPLTPADNSRYADLVFDPRRHRLLAVQERPTSSGGDETAALVAIPLPADPPAADAPAAAEPPPPTELVSGADFFSSPRLSPDGSRLAWLSWNHPDMPWDATTLWLADLDDAGLPQAPRAVAGGDPDHPEAVQQPSFDAQGRLTFISDRSGWWNLYRAGVGVGAPAFWPAVGATPRSGEPEPLCPRDAEFGVPPWLFGMSTYAHVAGGIVAACCERGVWGLVFLSEDTDGDGTLEPIPILTPYTSITWLRSAEAPEAGQKAGAPTPTPAAPTPTSSSWPPRRTGRPKSSASASPPPPTPPTPSPNTNSTSSPPPARPRTPAISPPAGPSTSPPPPAAAPTPSSTRRRTTTRGRRKAAVRRSSSRATAAPPPPPSTSTTRASSSGPRAASPSST